MLKLKQAVFTQQFDSQMTEILQRETQDPITRKSVLATLL